MMIGICYVLALMAALIGMATAHTGRTPWGLVILYWAVVTVYWLANGSK